MWTVLFNVNCSVFQMDINQLCTTCNINKIKTFTSKNRTFCKSRYNKNERKNNNNTLIQNQQPKSQLY